MINTDAIILQNVIVSSDAPRAFNAQGVRASRSVVFLPGGDWVRALREAMQNERDTVVWDPHDRDAYDYGYTFHVSVSFDDDNCPAEILTMMNVNSGLDDF
jgi:hypothetical protein